MSFTVVWRTMPKREEVRTASFSDLDDARREAQVFALAIPGTVETTIFDESGAQLDIAVRNNDSE